MGQSYQALWYQIKTIGANYAVQVDDATVQFTVQFVSR